MDARNRNRFMAFSFAAIVFCIVYALDLEGLRYFPEEHRWGFVHAGDAPKIAMKWYGRNLWAFSAAALAWGVVAITMRLRPSNAAVPSTRGIGFLSAAILLSFAGLMYAILYQEVFSK